MASPTGEALDEGKMKRNKILFVLLLLISITVVCTCGTFFYVKQNNKLVSDDSLLIMTSCNPVYLATLNVVQQAEGVTVQNLSQPTTGCLHDYTLTTEDMKNLSKADVLVVNGGGMEGYLEDVMEAYPNLPIIDTFEYLEHNPKYSDYIAIKEESHEESEVDHQGQEHHHDHGVNSHIWMSDLLHAGQVEAIAQGLEDIDGSNSSLYEANSKRYIEILSTRVDKLGLDNELAGSNIAVLHEAFEYTADSIGANVVADMDLDEERQVSAGEVSEFISAIKENDVKVVLAEYDYGNAMGKLITEQTDAKVVYLETMVHGQYEQMDYISVLNKNYANIRSVL